MRNESFMIHIFVHMTNEKNYVVHKGEESWVIKKC